MTIPELEQALRLAVKHDDFAASECCAREYREAWQRAAACMAPVDAAAGLAEACKVLAWARRSICAARARLRDELDRVQRAAVYQCTTGSEPVHSWRIDG